MRIISTFVILVDKMLTETSKATIFSLFSAVYIDMACVDSVHLILLFLGCVVRLMLCLGETYSCLNAVLR